mmetsp:Transcript_25612/g.33050  ORF Transcript_25612/g.33050 Transcript_25612/m.33050 type:complete len:355 (-) Transcript_25612:101-1165(-)
MNHSKGTLDNVTAEAFQSAAQDISMSFDEYFNLSSALNLQQKEVSFTQNENLTANSATEFQDEKPKSNVVKPSFMNNDVINLKFIELWPTGGEETQTSFEDYVGSCAILITKTQTKALKRNREESLSEVSGHEESKGCSDSMNTTTEPCTSMLVEHVLDFFHWNGIFNLSFVCTVFKNTVCKYAKESLKRPCPPSSWKEGNLQFLFEKSIVAQEFPNDFLQESQRNELVSTSSVVPFSKNGAWKAINSFMMSLKIFDHSSSSKFKVAVLNLNEYLAYWMLCNDLRMSYETWNTDTEFEASCGMKLQATLTSEIILINFHCDKNTKETTLGSTFNVFEDIVIDQNTEINSAGFIY